MERFSGGRTPAGGKYLILPGIPGMPGCAADCRIACYGIRLTDKMADFTETTPGLIDLFCKGFGAGIDLIKTLSHEYLK
jgi:hypothetical protein